MRHIKKVIKLSSTSCLSIRDIEKVTGLPRSTVNDYLNRFKQSGRNYKHLSELSDSQIYGKLFLDPVKKRAKVKPDFCYIHNELKRPHVTRQLLWEEYKQQHPHGFGYTQFCCTLGASSFTYAEASADQKLASFITSHINAFEYFEGTVQVLVPDNLKSAVSKADRYDPLINESYQDMAEHYNTVVIPARPYKAQDKSKVELAVKLVQRWILAKIRNEYPSGELRV